MVFESIKRGLGKLYEGGKRILGKASDLYKKGRSLGKHTLEHVREQHPSLYKMGLEAVYNSPYGDKLRGAEEVLRQIDNMADGSMAKRVDAIKSLGRMALKKDLNLAGALEKGAESGLRFVENQAEKRGMGGLLGALTPQIREQLGRGIRMVREKEEDLEREARGGGRMG